VFRGVQIFQNSRSPLEILGVRRVTRSKFDAQNTQIYVYYRNFEAANDTQALWMIKSFSRENFYEFPLSAVIGNTDALILKRLNFPASVWHRHDTAEDKYSGLLSTVYT